MSEAIMELDFAVPKDQWGDGPWQQEPDRVQFECAGFSCLILRSNWGHLCGYVGVPAGHPAYGKHPLTESLPLEAHGGLNYGAKCEGAVCHVPKPGYPEDVWWLGFDCGHSWDISPARQAFERASPFLSPELVDRLHNPQFGPKLTYRSLPYVKAEVRSLAHQLREMAPL